MLVVAPRPEPTESQMGYVLRLTELNGYPTTAYVLASMGRQWYQGQIGRLDAQHLAPLAGLTQAEIDRLTHQPSERPRAYVRVYGQDLPCYEVSIRRPKICPLCLAEGRPCEAFWDLAQAAACPVHEITLATHCPACSKAFRWARAKVRQCTCGADFTEAMVSPASPALCDLMAVMRNLVYRDAGQAPCPAAMSHLAHLDLRRFCKLLWVMCGLGHRTQGGRRFPKARCHYKSQLEGVAQALANWPLGFRTFLADSYDGVIQRSEELPHFRLLFNWLLVRLVKNDQEDGSAYAFLEREVYRFGAQYWTRGAMAREGGSQSLMPTRMRWLTLSEAGEVTGLHQMTLKKRIASGQIKTRRIRKNCIRALVVDLDSICEQPLTRYPGLSIRDAAPLVGVSIETLKALRACGACDENYRSVHPGSWTREDVDAFAAKFHHLRAEKRTVLAPGVTTLDATFKTWTASPKEKAGLLVRLLADDSLVVGKRRGAGVGRLQVHEETAKAYFLGVRAGQAVCLSVKKTAERLGCTSAVVTWLKRGGHIKARRQHGRDRPCVASVEEFHRRYEAIARTAARVGATAKSAYWRLDFSKFSHITVKTTQYSTIFVRRTDLPRIEKLLRAFK